MDISIINQKKENNFRIFIPPLNYKFTKIVIKSEYNSDLL